MRKTRKKHDSMEPRLTTLLKGKKAAKTGKKSRKEGHNLGQTEPNHELSVRKRSLLVSEPGKKVIRRGGLLEITGRQGHNFAQSRRKRKTCDQRRRMSKNDVIAHEANRCKGQGKD